MKLPAWHIILSGAAAAVLFTAPAAAQIDLNPNFAVSGFVDMSAYYASVDPGDSDNGANLDQVEIDFVVKSDPITGNVDLEWRNGDDIDIEQAYITYALSGGGSFTAGRFLSYMGFEGDEPYKLFQYSYAYPLGVPYAGYNDGVRYNFTSGGADFGVALVSANYDRANRVSDDFGLELKASFALAENWTVFAGYSFDNKDAAEDISFWNLWTQYTSGPMTYGVEVGYVDDEDGIVTAAASHLFWLVMANYAVNDSLAITGRVSGQNADDDGPSSVQLTFSPSYKITDKLLLVTEVSYVDYSDFEIDSSTLVAGELLFTF